MLFLRPLLGLVQGLITYGLIQYQPLSMAGTIYILILIAFPLFALQIKLPSRKILPQALIALFVIALVYGYVAYSLLNEISHFSANYLPPILATQCLLSVFIVFVFYCVFIEEERFAFPYPTLFSETWQIILKLILGQIFVSLTWALCVFAGILFKLLNISVVSNIVGSLEFLSIMLPFFFGIAMMILHQYEDILTRLRNILLAFCQFLYPIFVVISLSFLIVLPFAGKVFADFWQIIILLSVFNLMLFNGIFQAGLTPSPYPRWFLLVIYTFFLVLTGYSFYILKFPITNTISYGLKPDDFLLFVLLLILASYHLCYSFAVFFSKKTWLSMIKPSNTILAVIVALIYLCLALPLFNIGGFAAKNQLARLLDNRPISNPDKPYSNSGYLVGTNLQNVNLAGKDLSYVNFTHANLQGANLTGANLQVAELFRANLNQANLTGANLQSAHLSEANLSQANLSKANLTFAQLNKTNLSQSNFTGANLNTALLTQVICNKTNFTNANLTNVTGLQQQDLTKACGKNAILPEKLSLKPCPTDN